MADLLSIALYGFVVELYVSINFYFRLVIWTGIRLTKLQTIFWGDRCVDQVQLLLRGATMFEGTLERPT